MYKCFLLCVPVIFLSARLATLGALTKHGCEISKSKGISILNPAGRMIRAFHHAGEPFFFETP